MIGRFGDYSVVDSKRLLLPGVHEGWLQFAWEDEKVDINVVFVTENGGNISARVEGLGDHSRITFRNWNNILGTSTARPVRIGNTDKQEALSIVAVSWVIAETRIVEVQLMVGGTP